MTHAAGSYGSFQRTTTLSVAMSLAQTENASVHGADVTRRLLDWRRVVVQAYILIQTEVGRAREVAAAIDGVNGIVRVDAVTGPYDVVVLAESNSVDELGKMIVSAVQMVPGITRTLTCSVVHL